MIDSIPVLGMEGVSKSFPAPRERVEVLHQVSLAVFRGEFVGVTGPSGSGKSTCLHLAALLDHPTSGRVVFEGQDMSSAAESELCQVRKRKIGMVFQKYCLLPHRSVFENVLFRFRYLNHDRADAERRVMDVLETMGLTAVAGRPARLLSGGEMQRVAIARAVAHEPRLLIADEPTGNLDRSSANGVMECFRGLNRSGITILLVTHNEALLDSCSRHLSCRDGRIENSVH
jgi:putative ABC transport system ATP-binding protein